MKWILVSLMNKRDGICETFVRSPASEPLRGKAGQRCVSPRFNPVVGFKKQIRRGGVPSGAAAFIATGGMGASAPIIISDGNNSFGTEVRGPSPGDASLL